MWIEDIGRNSLSYAGNLKESSLRTIVELHPHLPAKTCDFKLVEDGTIEDRQTNKHKTKMDKAVINIPVIFSPLAKW